MKKLESSGRAGKRQEFEMLCFHFYFSSSSIYLGNDLVFFSYGLATTGDGLKVLISLLDNKKSASSSDLRWNSKTGGISLHLE